MFLITPCFLMKNLIHTQSTYTIHPSWPKDPLFYASFPSISDNAFAPKEKEAATFLIPIASGIEDTEAHREKYFDIDH